MEKLINKREIVFKTLKTLEESLIDLHNPKFQEVYDNLRDSVIQRFEYSIDTFWKFLMLYLKEKEQIDIELSSPRAILKQASNVGLLDSKSYETLIECIGNRNLTSHMYNEDLADEVVKSIPAYHSVIKSITEKLEV